MSDEHLQNAVAGPKVSAYYFGMSLEQHILEGIKRLSDEKRKAVLAFVESMQETESGRVEEVLSAEEQEKSWNEWTAHGPQGPIEEDAPPDFP